MVTLRDAPGFAVAVIVLGRLFPCVGAKNSSRVTSADWPRKIGVMVTVPVSISEVVSSDSTDVAVTGSSQTVCQIPVTDVYQMPPGRLTCLPRGWAALS